MGDFKTMDLPQVVDANGNSSVKKKTGKRLCSPQGVGGNKKKKLKLHVLPSSQTPLAILNELRTGLVYKIVSTDGPPHNPNFKASVEVDGMAFYGTANSKQQAKQKAAEAALQTLCPSVLSTVKEPINVDFTEDTNNSNLIGNSADPKVNVTSAPLVPKKNKLESLIPKAICGMINPIMALNEIMPRLKYECVTENSPKSISPFVFAVKVDNEIYQGSGNSKKQAKAATARAVLMQKFANVYNSSLLMDPFYQNYAATLQPIAANKIAELVTRKYSELMLTHPEWARRKVLAGIVMTTNGDCTNGEIISVSTGTKCVSGDRMSVRGAVLNDCHAEIISRRGLLHFFYQQLLLQGQPETSNASIFVLREDGFGFKLRPEVKFHLYISTSPCGDARIFSPHDISVSSDDISVDKHPNRQSRGQLRTKIESGEGTIPVKSADSIQTWDGVMQGERLLTMSCSDKVAKWNIVGLQGSLLSHFIEPVYLHSIVVGSLFHPSHLRRAVYSRIENTLSGLPPPYRLNQLLMNSTSSPESRQPGKAPNYSVNWISSDDKLEIVNASTGTCLSGLPSRLCKQSLFGNFLGLLNLNLPTKTGLSAFTAPEVYLDAKRLAADYNDAKDHMYDAFKKAGLGCWMKKPVEQDEFYFESSMLKSRTN